MEQKKRKWRLEGITKRWVVNTLGIILLVFLIATIIAGFAIKKYYYSTVHNSLTAGANGTNYFDLYFNNKNESFEKGAMRYVEKFKEKEHMEVWVLDSSGKVILTSSGFMPDQSQSIPDYANALGSDTGQGEWIGKLPSGERVMALTKMLPTSQNNQNGAVRFIASLEYVDQQIRTLLLLIVFVILAVLAVVVLSNLFFIQSIVIPVREIGDTAKEIARGDFNARINKKYDDEIGALCDTINYMAGEIAAADRMKNDFISTVSHELRTPLTAIKGWGETLVETPDLDPTMHRGLQVIIGEAGRLSGFVEELLDFSRMQSGRMTLRMDKIDVLAELDEAVFVFKERAHREGIEVSYNAPDLPAPAYADANRIKQVFVNILDNALKYTHEGGRLFVSAELAVNQIQIVIADNGCGIPAKDLPRIKEKFYKANISVRGSGIGLAVADEIIAMHQGSLEIESVEGEGTTVYITLPLDVSPPEIEGGQGNEQ